jgi:basic membrane protein A
MKKRIHILFLSGILSFFALAWNSLAPAAVAENPLKIGFIMVGPVADWGWNYQHDQGRLYMESKMGDKVKTTVAENVPESAEVERVMEKMIAQGNKLIFATSYGYLDPALRVAARHPDVIIMHCGRPTPKGVKNFGSYGLDFHNHYGPQYVAGMIVGRMTKKNEIGYVAAHPVPPLLLTLNAFTLGARSVNPKVKVHVVWTNNWSDPPTEAEAAKGLIDRGVDVLAAHLDSTVTVVQTAEKNHLYSVGYHADVHHLAPKGWLAGECWDFGPFYLDTVRSVLNHTWKPGDDSLGSKFHYGKLSVIGPVVPKSLQEQALALLRDIDGGKMVIFKGPMKDRDGRQRLAAGEVPGNDYLGKVDWLVPGIEGSVPKK